MKKILFALLLLGTLQACEEIKSDKKASENIDQGVKDAKELIDVFSEQAKKFLDSKEIDKIKEVADEVLEKSKEIKHEIEKDSTMWKEKLEELKNDKDIKNLIENHKGDAQDILKKIEEIFKEVSEEVDNKNKKAI